MIRVEKQRLVFTLYVADGLLVTFSLSTPLMTCTTLLDQFQALLMLTSAVQR